MLKTEKFESGIVTFHSHKNTFDFNQSKRYFRHLVSRGFTVVINNGLIRYESLFGSQIFILMRHKENLGAREIAFLKEYVKMGGKLLITDYCGKSTNVNLFLKSYGIQFLNDSVLRTHHCKYYHHPCESLISDGVVNESLYHMEQEIHQCSHSIYKSFPILYPFGCTLDVKSPSVVLMSTGGFCLPFHRPICAFYREKCNQGRIVAIGSSDMFLDSYISKEHNFQLLQILLDILVKEDVYLSIADVQSPDISDYYTIPDLAVHSDIPFSYLQETEDTVDDLSLLKDKLTEFGNCHFVKVLSCYKELKVEHKKLSIIKPKFESPLPEIEPALMPPRFRDLNIPALELLDLDEFFMCATSRLDQLTYKYTDEDLEFYIVECGKALAIPTSENAKCIIYFVCNYLSLRKRNNQFLF